MNPRHRYYFPSLILFGDSPHWNITYRTHPFFPGEIVALGLVTAAIGVLLWTEHRRFRRAHLKPRIVCCCGHKAHPFDPCPECHCNLFYPCIREVKRENSR